jgi:hypothetical protein
MLLNRTRGIFVMKHAGTTFRKFLLRRMHAGMVFWNLIFPGIGVTNTTLLQHDFGSLFAL